MLASGMVPSHGVILAAGSGSRMPPLVTATPKALLPIANEPMLYHSIRCLLSARVRFITVVVPSAQEDVFRGALDAFSPDTSAPADSAPPIVLHLAPPDSGTADVLRALSPCADDVLVLAADYVGDVPLQHLLEFHCHTNASFTAALTRSLDPPLSADVESSAKSGKNTKSGKASKSAKQSKPPKHPDPDHYALLEGSLLHALLRPTDLTASTFRIPPALIKHGETLSLRSDLFDPHVYVIHLPTVSPILNTYSSISSLRFDLLPYLARRQAVLTRREIAPHPVSVQAFIVPCPAARANTAAEFLRLNLARVRQDKAEKPRKGKPRATNLPFHTVGERVSVSESTVKGGTAGDKVSIKKSVIGQVTLATGVKINGCVLMDDVQVGEGANLSGCIICKSAVIEPGAVLKDCRVAEGVSVSSSAEGKDFAGDVDNDWGEDIEFC